MKQQLATANLAKHLQSVLQDQALYASIMAMDNQSISDLSQALQSALNVAKNVIYLRTHEETPA